MLCLYWIKQIKTKKKNEAETMTGNDFRLRPILM